MRTWPPRASGTPFPHPWQSLPFIPRAREAYQRVALDPELFREHDFPAFGARLRFKDPLPRRERILHDRADRKKLFLRKPGDLFHKGIRDLRVDVLGKDSRLALADERTFERGREKRRLQRHAHGLLPPDVDQ